MQTKRRENDGLVENHVVFCRIVKSLTNILRNAHADLIEIKPVSVFGGFHHVWNDISDDGVDVTRERRRGGG